MVTLIQAIAGPLESEAERAKMRPSGSKAFSASAQSMIAHSPAAFCCFKTALKGE